MEDSYAEATDYGSCDTIKNLKRDKGQPDLKGFKDCVARVTSKAAGRKIKKSRRKTRKARKTRRARR